MDIFAILLIIMLILLVILFIGGFIFKFYIRNKTAKTIIVINSKNRRINGAETSQELHVIPVKSVHRKAIIEPSKEQQRRKNDVCENDELRGISMPGYIPREIAAEKDDKDQAKKSLSQNSELRRPSQVSLSNALAVSKEERRLSSAQMSELQLMDVGALPRDVASELEEKEKQKKDRQKWCP